MRIVCAVCHQGFPSLVEHLASVNWHERDTPHFGDPECSMCQIQERMEIATQALQDVEEHPNVKRAHDALRMLRVMETAERAMYRPNVQEALAKAMEFFGTQPKVCDFCDGAGDVDDLFFHIQDAPQSIICPQCHGKGTVP